MLVSKHRFHGRNSLRYVYGRGKTVRGTLFAIKYAPNSRRNDWRAAVVVSRKISKSAVVRNRIRRRMYELIRLNSQKIQGSYDIVITVFSEEVARMDFEELGKQLEDQLKRAGISVS